MKLFELPPDLAKIVNLAVVHHPVSAARGLHRLMPQGGEIEYRQSPVTKHRTTVRDGVNATVVRAAVP